MKPDLPAVQQSPSRGTVSTVAATDKPVARTVAVPFEFNPNPPRRSGLVRRRRFVSAMSVLSLAFTLVASGLQGRTLDLVSEAEVDSSGVLVGSLFPALAQEPAGAMRLANAPEFGKTFTLDRAAIEKLLREKAPALVATNLAGATTVSVRRRSRLLAEEEVREWLKTILQKEQVRDRGELELRMTRPWQPVAVPDEPLSFRVVDLPMTGVGSSFMARIAVDCGETRIGTWPVVLQARIWQDVLVAGATLARGQPLRGADVRTERRDLLLTRDCVTPDAVEKGDFEFVTTVSTGQLVTGRALRIRPAVTRGTIVDGLVADGAMTISLKVEVLEDGVVGQNLRVRNLKTRREMLGKVRDEQTIVLYL